MDKCAYKLNFNEVIERRREFHEEKMKDRILFSVSSMKKYPYPDRARHKNGLIPLPPTGTELDDVTDIKLLAPKIDQFFTQFSGVTDDSLPMSEFLNYFGHAVVCEILEHPIKRIALGSHSGSVVEKHLGSLTEAMELKYDENSPSVTKIREYLQYAQNYSNGRWFNSPYVMADGLHVLTQLFGYVQAYMMLYDDPEGVHSFCRKMLDINIRFFEMQYEIAGPVAGGYICNRSDWNPVKCISINLDDYLFCADEVLEEFGIPYMQQIIDHFGTGIIHYHTSDTRLMKAVNKLKNVKIQIGSDPNLPEPIDCMKEIREVIPDMPITWMRINREDFINKLHKKELYGNTEYLVSGIIDTNDANELYKMSKEYLSVR